VKHFIKKHFTWGAPLVTLAVPKTGQQIGPGSTGRSLQRLAWLGQAQKPLDFPLPGAVKLDFFSSRLIFFLISPMSAESL